MNLAKPEKHPALKPSKLATLEALKAQLETLKVLNLIHPKTKPDKPADASSSRQRQPRLQGAPFGF